GDAARLDGRSQQLLYLAFRDLDLSDDRGLVHAALHSRPAALHQLGGAECRQHHELKRTHSWWTVNHSAPPNRLVPSTASATIARSATGAVRTVRRNCASSRT